MEGTVTISLEYYHELLDLSAKVSPTTPAITENLHNKWHDIFVSKGLLKRDYIKLESHEAKELLTNLIKIQ